MSRLCHSLMFVVVVLSNNGISYLVIFHYLLLISGNNA